MPEQPDTDELVRLRSADPVEHLSLPSPHGPEALALFERIIADVGSDARVAPRAGSWRSPLLVAAAVVALALVTVTGLVAVRESRETPDDDIAAGAPTSVATGGAISPGGAAVGSCVEVYDLNTLAQRETAFDGTVQGVSGDTVTFTVNRWFRGGDDPEVTLGGASGLQGLTSAGSGATLEPGTRLLVAGDGGFAWSCGFTQPYDASVAREWEGAFGS